MLFKFLKISYVFYIPTFSCGQNGKKVQREKVQKSEYLESKESFFNETKSIFYNFLSACF